MERGVLWFLNKAWQMFVTQAFDSRNKLVFALKVMREMSFLFPTCSFLVPGGSSMGNCALIEVGIEDGIQRGAGVRGVNVNDDSFRSADGVDGLFRK